MFAFLIGRALSKRKESQKHSKRCGNRYSGIIGRPVLTQKKIRRIRGGSFAFCSVIDLFTFTSPCNRIEVSPTAAPFLVYFTLLFFRKLFIWYKFCHILLLVYFRGCKRPFFRRFRWLPNRIFDVNMRCLSQRWYISIIKISKRKEILCLLKT